MGKGKGRRRRQANYLAAHGGQTTLPAPPSSSDLAVVPSKLRRIISLKASSQGNTSECGNISTSRTKIVQSGKGLTQKQVLRGKREDSSSQIKDFGERHESLGISREEQVPVKMRKKEEDLQVLMEKYKFTPVRKGLSEQKKRYLQEKKKKKKKKSAYLDPVENHSLHEKEKVGFGDVVEAPPKLHFPNKQMKISDERLRLQAVETYRQKRKWLSRPGSHQPPPLQTVNIPRV